MGYTSSIAHSTSNIIVRALIESRDSWGKTQMHNTFFDWFSMDLPLFLRDGFQFVFIYKKERHLILGKFV